jgi:hypothetical protein
MTVPRSDRGWDPQAAWLAMAIGSGLVAVLWAVQGRMAWVAVKAAAALAFGLLYWRARRASASTDAEARRSR